jgi:CspA family cold shock protein
MTKGTVKFYNAQKGLRLHRAGRRSKDVFVHATALERAGINMVEGQKGSFDTELDSRSGKAAVAASKPRSPERQRKLEFEGRPSGTARWY